MAGAPVALPVLMASVWSKLVHTCRAQWLRGRTLDSTTRTRVRILCCVVKTLGKFLHSTLLQFTQLYKGVPGYRQWWICVRAAFMH